MVTKILSLLSLLALPMSATLWHKSHSDPIQYRWDVTIRKSMRVYLKDGVFGMRILTLPTTTAIRSEFKAPLTYNALPDTHAIMLSSRRKGNFTITWLIFPLWLSTVSFGLLTVLPIVRGPMIRRWRQWHGNCSECGYDLRGSRRRCPECGTCFP